MMRDTTVVSKYNCKGSVLHGNRPVLIISSDMGNRTSTVVTVLKITSADARSSRSINVGFINSDGETNVILCNQITTIDKSNLLEYMYTLSDDIIAEVEKSIDISLGRHREDIDTKIDNIYTILEDLKVFKANQYHNTSKDEEFISNVAGQLKELYINMAKYHDSSVEDVKKNLISLSEANVKTRLNLNVPTDNDSKTDNVSIGSTNDKSEHMFVTKDMIINDTSNVSESHTKRKRSPNKSNKPKGYWTEERIKSFIEDKKTMTVEDWMTKYEYTDRQAIMKAYYTYSSKLNKG